MTVAATRAGVSKRFSKYSGIEEMRMKKMIGSQLNIHKGIQNQSLR